MRECLKRAGWFLWVCVLLATAGVATGTAMTREQSRAALEDAEVLLAQNRFQEVIELLEPVISTSAFPLYAAKAQWKRGQALCGLENHEAACTEFEAALESGSLQPSQEFEIRLDLLRALARAGDTNAVPPLLARIRAEYFGNAAPMYTDPKHFCPPDKANMLVARVLWNCGMPDEALPFALAAAGPANRRQQQAAIIAARAYAAKGDTAGANRVLEGALGQGKGRMGPYTGRIYEELVRMALRSGDNAQALTWAAAGMQRLARDPSCSDYCYRIAGALRARGIPEWQAYMDSAAASPKKGARMRALEDLAAQARRSGRWGDVERYGKRLIALPERGPESFTEDYLMLMRALAEQGKDISQVSAGLVSFSDKAGPKHAQALGRIARELETVGRADEAENVYRRVIGFGTNDTASLVCRMRLADLLSRRGRGDAALAEYWAYIGGCRDRGDFVHAAQGLVKLAQSPASAAAGSVQNIDAVIQENLALIADVKTLCGLAVFLKNRGRDDLAVQCVLKASSSPGVPPGRPVGEKVDTEQVLIRRMTEVGLFAEAIARADAISPDELNDPSVSLETRSDVLYYKARALLRLGHREEAERRFNDLLDLVISNCDLHPAYAVAIAVDLHNIHPARAKELFGLVANGDSKTAYSALARLYLAAEAIRAGDLPSAEAGILIALQAVPADATLGWQRSVYWTAKFLEGVVLSRRGDSRGQALMQEAEAEAEIWQQIEQIVEGSSGT